MPPELLPVVRKDILKERKSSSSEPVEIVSARWRESPTTPSSHPKNPWSGGDGGPSDFRRPFTGSRVSADYGNQKDPKRGHSTETNALPNRNFNPQSDIVNSWDQLHSNHQHANNDGGVSVTGGQKLEKGNSLGPSLDWRPMKWIRSGSLSSRGSGFNHSSSCKIIGVESLDTKAEPGNDTVVQAAPCVTPSTPDESNSRKKARLGWGEGLAKYEKKKVDPNDVIDKETGRSNGMIDGVSSSEPSLSSPFNFPAKSPSVGCYSERASPTTSCSFACSSSPGVEEKTTNPEATQHTDTSNHSHVSQNHRQDLTFSLENLDLPEGFNVSSLLDELLQTDETSVPGSGFAMNKLQVWKTDVSKTLEITESEIDSLENELKSLTSDGGSRKECNKNVKDLRIVTFGDAAMEKSNEERNAAEDLESPATSTSKLAEINSVNLESRVSTVSVGDVVQNNLYGSILASNNVTAKETSDEISKVLPTRFRTVIARETDDSSMAEKVATRKRFLKFKERVIGFKFRALHYNWKKDLCKFSVKKSGLKLQKKSEFSLRMGFVDYRRHRFSIHTRLSSPAGSLSLVPTKEMVEYAKNLLSDSQVKISSDVQKMPTFILDRGTRTSTRFISDNGLVENPIEVEKEKTIVNAWTVEDKETFLDKYSRFGKNFRKIASFFPNKTVADCVEFYYKNHKCDDFQKTKRNSEFAKGKSCNTTANTYLVTSGKQRRNRETGVTSSLDVLGAASAMVSNVNVAQPNDFDSFCNDQETAAADVLAGICGSISPEALGSCVTDLADHGDVHGVGKLGNSSMRYVDEETCSDDSCGDEIDSSHWTDEEKSSFMKAVRTYGKDFLMISRCVRTRSSDQCRVYFSKTKNCFGLDAIGGGSDHDDTCIVDSGSGISHDKSLTEVDELHSSDRNVVSERTGPAFVVENPVKRDCEADLKPDEISLNVNLEGAADSEANEAVNVESSPQTYSDSASGAKVEEITESKHELLSHCGVNDVSVTYYSRAGSLNLGVDHERKLDLNAASENGLFVEKLERKTVSQDDVSSRLSFRKSDHQRSSSIDGYQLRLPKRCNEPQSNFKLDESLFTPIDGCIQICPYSSTVSREQRRCSSLDMEKPSQIRDVKLFGQILTNNPSSNSMFENNSAHRKLSSLDYVKNKETAFGVEKSYGFWDVNRIRTGFSSLPDSAALLAKYPSAFSDVSTLSKLDHHPSLEIVNEQCNVNVASSFSSRKLGDISPGPSYHPYKQSFTVDNLKLLPEITRRKEMEASVQQVKGLNGVGGACNGVSDPVAAIRMHYARTDGYKNGGGSGECWRSNNISDIGSR